MVKAIVPDNCRAGNMTDDVLPIKINNNPFAHSTPVFGVTSMLVSLLRQDVEERELRWQRNSICEEETTSKSSAKFPRDSFKLQTVFRRKERLNCRATPMNERRGIKHKSKTKSQASHEPWARQTGRCYFLFGLSIDSAEIQSNCRYPLNMCRSGTHQSPPSLAGLRQR